MARYIDVPLCYTVSKGKKKIEEEEKEQKVMFFLVPGLVVGHIGEG